MKTKTKFYGHEATNFHDNYHTVISLDYIIKSNESFYQQMFLKECKYIEKKVIRHISDDLQSSPDESDEE